jgi:DNA polymerase-3 subunit delta
MAGAKTTKSSAPFYAVVGSDEAEVKRVARGLAAELSPGGDFSCDVVDGCVDHAEQAAERIHQTIEALLTFPFLGGEKLVWLKNASFLDDSVTARAEAVTEALEKLLETLRTGIPEKTRFLLSAIDVDKRRSFYKALQKLAKLQVFDQVDPGKNGWEQDAIDLSRTIAERQELTFSADALELFALFTGGDRRTVESEIEKLDLFLGRTRRRVSAQDVRALVPPSRAGVIFELGNALAERDLPRCLALLDQLLFHGESAIGLLLATIIPTVRNLLLARDLIDRHRLGRPAQPFTFGRTLERLPASAIAHLPRKKDGTVNFYSLGIAAMNAHRYRIKELRTGLKACLNANVQLVTTSLEPKIVLTRLLVSIVAQPEMSRGKSESASLTRR